jgi:hypothetical protein
VNHIIKYGLLLCIILFLVLLPERILFDTRNSICVFRNLTGIECPLCGMTRASYCLLHFGIIQAVRLNPASLFLPILLAIEILYDITHVETIAKLRRIVFIGFFAALALLFITRITLHFSLLHTY